MSSDKVVVRVKGGLGNQLFGYAAGRRLAHANQAELVIDDVTGFLRDYQYHRQYELDKFAIRARKATAGERMEPLERYRRGFLKLISRRRRFQRRRYIEQEGLNFDPRLLEFRLKGTIYLDGYWQSENYFKDIAETIRQDLRMVAPQDSINLRMAEQMRCCNAVALHVRWFNNLESKREKSENNLDREYYIQAINRIKEQVSNPHFFLFSDDLASAKKMLGLSESMITCVEGNHMEQADHLDLWLMTCCKHFIIANSTFSWWGAWLGESDSTIVVAPARQILTGNSAWGFDGLIPGRWLTC